VTLATISVIIPTTRLDETLKSLLAQLGGMDIFEILIIQPLDSKPVPKLEQNCEWLTAPKGRGSQIQAGLDTAQGDILWILHADSIVPNDAVSDIYDIIQDPVTAMGCFPLKFNYPSLSLKLFAAFSHLSTQLTTFGDQGFFFKSTLKDELPDLNPYPLLEDVMLYRALRKKGRIVKAKSSITTNANRFRRLGIWRTQWRNAVTLWKFHKGVSVKKLYDAYYL